MDLGTAAPERLGRTRLRDGRHLAWSEWGPPDGRPVLLFPGAATSRSLGFGTHLLDGLGVRLVSLDRPGLGGSDPHPGRDLTSWAQDVRELCERAGLRDAAGVAFSQGSAFGFACAAAGLLSTLSVVSGADDLHDPSTRALLEPQLRTLARACAEDPAAAERRFADGSGPERLQALVEATSGPADRAAYSRPDFSAAFRRALAEAFRQGPGGYARDTVLAMGPWPFDVADLAVPVDLWYGELDTSPVHSPDHGRRLHERIPASTRTLVPGAGGALLWTHAQEVLTGLLRRAAEVRAAPAAARMSP
ncbi:alpha/beta fold hydrolase [Kineococcus sp. SYSU DK006]|uniref:alpha/beta fold hydrolase n=1 Tax=Kineococcus sp. SYSU DK006 TaxID=3383127 RepID=UPI003D7DA163